MVAIQARLPVATPVPRPEPVLHLPASSTLLIIVERKEDWSDYLPSESIVTAQEYLEDRRLTAGGGRIQVLNLCRNYRYLGHGYYCSLLAEARGHRVIPSVRTLSELNRKALYGLLLEDLDALVDQALAEHPLGATEGFTLNLYFGRTEFAPLQALARQLFDAFPCPILQVAPQSPLAHRRDQERRPAPPAGRPAIRLRRCPGCLQPAHLAATGLAAPGALRPGHPA